MCRGTKSAYFRRKGQHSCPLSRTIVPAIFFSRVTVHAICGLFETGKEAAVATVRSWRMGQATPAVARVASTRVRARATLGNARKPAADRA